MIHVINVAWVRGILLMHHATFASLARSACAFAEVKERFYKPAEGYTPIIVVHSSFAWDSKFPIILHSLLKVPYAHTHTHTHTSLLYCRHYILSASTPRARYITMLGILQCCCLVSYPLRHPVHAMVSTDEARCVYRSCGRGLVGWIKYPDWDNGTPKKPTHRTSAACMLCCFIFFSFLLLL